MKLSNRSRLELRLIALLLALVLFLLFRRAFFSSSYETDNVHHTIDKTTTGGDFDDAPFPSDVGAYESSQTRRPLRVFHGVRPPFPDALFLATEKLKERDQHRLQTKERAMEAIRRKNERRLRAAQVADSHTSRRLLSIDDDDEVNGKEISTTEDEELFVHRQIAKAKIVRTPSPTASPLPLVTHCSSFDCGKLPPHMPCPGNSRGFHPFSCKPNPKVNKCAWHREPCEFEEPAAASAAAAAVGSAASSTAAPLRALLSPAPVYRSRSHVPEQIDPVCRGCFGAVGSRLWCRCCKSNCGGYRDDCRKNGYCTTHCMDDVDVDWCELPRMPTPPPPPGIVYLHTEEEVEAFNEQQRQRTPAPTPIAQLDRRFRAIPLDEDGNLLEFSSTKDDVEEDEEEGQVEEVRRRVDRASSSSAPARICIRSSQCYESAGEVCRLGICRCAVQAWRLNRASMECVPVALLDDEGEPYDDELALVPAALADASSVLMATTAATKNNENNRISDVTIDKRRFRILNDAYALRLPRRVIATVLAKASDLLLVSSVASALRLVNTSLPLVLVVNADVIRSLSSTADVRDFEHRLRVAGFDLIRIVEAIRVRTLSSTVKNGGKGGTPLSSSSSTSTSSSTTAPGTHEEALLRRGWDIKKTSRFGLPMLSIGLQSSSSPSASSSSSSTTATAEAGGDGNDNVVAHSLELTRLRIFELIEFERVLYVSTDTFVVRNLDHLIEDEDVRSREEEAGGGNEEHPIFVSMRVQPELVAAHECSSDGASDGDSAVSLATRIDWTASDALPPLSSMAGDFTCQARERVGRRVYRIINDAIILLRPSHAVFIDLVDLLHEQSLLGGDSCIRGRDGDNDFARLLTLFAWGRLGRQAPLLPTPGILYCDQLVSMWSPLQSKSTSISHYPSGVYAIRYRGAHRMRGDQLLVPWLHAKKADACGAYRRSYHRLLDQWMEMQVERWAERVGGANRRQLLTLLSETLSFNASTTSQEWTEAQLPSLLADEQRARDEASQVAPSLYAYGLSQHVRARRLESGRVERAASKNLEEQALAELIVALLLRRAIKDGGMLTKPTMRIQPPQSFFARLNSQVVEALLQFHQQAQNKTRIERLHKFNLEIEKLAFHLCD